MKVYVVSKKPNVLDFSFNKKIIITELKKASMQGCDAFVTSELFLTGYPIEDRIFFSDFEERVNREVKDILTESKKHPDIFLLIGSPIFKKEGIFNGVLVIKGGIIENIILKSYLPNYGVFDEKRYFKHETNLQIIKIKEKSVLIAICEDIWSEDYLQKARLLKPDLIIVLNASPFEKGKFEKRIRIASQFKTPLIYVNQILGYDELVFEGGSFALNKKGELTHLFPFFHEKSEVINPFASKTASIKTPQVYDALVFGLKEYARQNPSHGLLVGLSGGVDSALVSKIAIDAVGVENFEAVLLPSQISSNQSLKDAMDFIKLHNIKYTEISIKQITELTEKTLMLKKDLSKQNLQSRIRGLLLMALSNESGKMLLTTGNKSELATGYCTIYGDMNGGFNPIKDLFKTEVYELCKYLNCFPKNMLTKPATAELKANQTDETSLGITYKMLDFILARIIEQNLSADQISKQISKESFNELLDFRANNNLPAITKISLLKYVFSLISKSEFKRKQAPIGTKISSRSFGRDWRFGLYF